MNKYKILSISLVLIAAVLVLPKYANAGVCSVGTYDDIAGLTSIQLDVCCWAYDDWLGGDKCTPADQRPQGTLSELTGCITDADIKSAMQTQWQAGKNYDCETGGTSNMCTGGDSWTTSCDSPTDCTPSVCCRKNYCNLWHREQGSFDICDDENTKSLCGPCKEGYEDADDNLTTVEACVASVGGVSLWTESGNDIYYDTGNVGIGTDSPSYQLDIEGGSNTAKIQINNTEGVSGGYDPSVNFLIDDNQKAVIGYDRSENLLKLVTGTQISNLTGLAVTDAGKVGIGTNDPQKNLHIFSPDQYTGMHITANSNTWNFGTWSGGDHLNINGPASSYLELQRDANNSYVTVGASTGNTGHFNVYGTGYFYGNVGIGVTSPSNKLQVSGDIRATGCISNDEICQYDNSMSTHVLNTDYVYEENNDGGTLFLGTKSGEVEIRGTTIFDCEECGSSSVIDGSSEWGRLTMQGRVISADANIYLSPPGGSNVIINDTYRAAGGSTSGAAGLSVEGTVSAGDFTCSNCINGSAIASNTISSADLSDYITVSGLTVNGTINQTYNSSAGSLHYYTNSSTGNNADILSLQVSRSIAEGSNCWIKFQDGYSDGVSPASGHPTNRGTICGYDTGSGSSGIAIGAKKVKISDIYTPIIYDINNTARYLNPSVTSRVENIYYYGGHGAGSDTRVKLNQRDIEYGLDEVMALQPKSYDYHGFDFDDDAGLVLEEKYTEKVGLVAQEVNEIIPEAAKAPYDEDKDVWTLDYNQIIPVLVKGMQEQQEIIDNLEVRISKLEK